MFRRAAAVFLYILGACIGVSSIVGSHTGDLSNGEYLLKSFIAVGVFAVGVLVDKDVRK